MASEDDVRRAVLRDGIKGRDEEIARLQARPGMRDDLIARDIAERLREWVRSRARGTCHILTLGDKCLCPLCDIDRLVALTAQGEPACKGCGGRGVVGDYEPDGCCGSIVVDKPCPDCLRAVSEGRR